MNQARHNETGDTLLEVLIAMSIISVALVVFVLSLSTGTMGVGASNRLTTAHNLALSQLETVKGSAYDVGGNYPHVPTTPPYLITLDVQTLNSGLQQVTVTVTYAGETLSVISNYKVER